MIFILIILTFYCFLLLILQIGWHKAVGKHEIADSATHPLISVIIPVRNEQENISRTLQSIRNQTYSNFEVIIVNDHSSDNTVAVALQNKFPSVSIIESHQTGKKAALQAGIDLAKGELIVTTDGDCMVNENWLETINRTFASDKVVFAFGAVAIRSDSYFFSKLQAVEFASLIGSGAATSALGFPIMCNGANLAFRKTVFIEVNGYEGNQHIASGDDEFLLRKIQKHYPEGIKFIAHQAASVVTSPKKSLSEFVSQRLRWAGKWKHNTSFPAVALALYIFVLQLCFIGACITLARSFNYSLALLLLIKLVFEASFIRRVCMFSKSTFSWTAFLFLQVIYPFYVIATGILANFIHPSWKDRRIKAESLKHKA